TLLASKCCLISESALSPVPVICRSTLCDRCPVQGLHKSVTLIEEELTVFRHFDSSPGSVLPTLQIGIEAFSLAQPVAPVRQYAAQPPLPDVGMPIVVLDERPPQPIESRAP